MSRHARYSSGSRSGFSVQQQGFTLPEIITTLAIVGILSGLAAPGLQALTEQKQGETTLRTLAEHLALARASAANYGRTVTFCRSADGLTCSGNWSDGSIVFTDRNADRLINQDDLLLRSQVNTQLQGSIEWRAFQNRQYLQIEATGFMRYQSGNFLYCPHDGDPRNALQLIVNNTGRARYAVDSNGDGVREDSSGKPLACQL
ncbi:MAG: GspH/FimT family pseudopilin [Gammaproteobacteria bacterium]|nr:GspH/FimT family pseudopilin [Gammaproteobacteria bacterium]